MNWNERDLEDWAEQYMGPLIHPKAECIGRQITLPSGKRLDLLFHFHGEGGPSEYIVVELKAVAPTPADLVQLLGYVDELQAGVRSVGHVRGILAGPNMPAEVTALARRMNGIHATEVAACLDFAVFGSVWERPNMEHQAREIHGTPDNAIREVFRAQDGTEDRFRFRATERAISELLEALTPVHPDDVDDAEEA